MSTYLSRPVFDFPINWAETPSKEFSYDSRELLLGYASPRVAPLQTHTVHGYQFEVVLENEAAIMGFETFADGLKGRLNGFWFPSPFDACKILEGVSATEFLIQDQGLRFHWEETASLHLRFTKPGAAAQYGKIVSVTDDAKGHEKVTLESGLGTAVDASWDANKLLYVRLADDTEQLRSPADNVERRTLKLIELSTEYAAAETGQRPVFLYEFFHDGVGPRWRFTGLNQDIASNGNAFSTFPIEHKDHVQSIEGDQDQLTLVSYYDSANPMAQFLPFRMGRQLQVTVRETTFGAPDTAAVVFQGFCTEALVKGRLLTVKCESFMDVLGRNFPAFFIQPRCNYFLYSGPCGVSPTAYTLTAEITEIASRFVTLEPASPPSWFEELPGGFFAFGYLEAGDKATSAYEVRGVVNSSYRVETKCQIELAMPLAHAQVGDTVTVVAGCDGTAATCRAKFNNFRRWGGHSIAPQNLSVKAMQAETVNGNKK